MPIGCVLWIILIVVFSISMYDWGGGYHNTGRYYN